MSPAASDCSGLRSDRLPDDVAPVRAICSTGVSATMVVAAGAAFDSRVSCADDATLPLAVEEREEIGVEWEQTRGRCLKNGRGSGLFRVGEVLVPQLGERFRYERRLLHPRLQSAVPWPEATVSGDEARRPRGCCR